MKPDRLQYSAGRLAFQDASPNRTSRFLALGSLRLVASVALVVFGLLFAVSGAKAAGCAVPLKAGDALLRPLAGPQVNGAWQQEGDGPNQPATIVGMWHLIYTGNSDDNFPPGGPYPPTPFTFLESFKIWHADGTEFENAFLPPTGGNICFGVWKNLGHGSVKLHHIGLMFDPVSGSITSIFTVDETDTVAPDGKTYSGHFDFRLWPPSFDAVGVGSPISEVTGDTKGTRITVD